MFLRFSRYRFREGAAAEGLEILRRHASTLHAAPGCEHVWLGQGQHPSTEFVVLALFRDEDSMWGFEGRLRTDPSVGSDTFALLRLTTDPPELIQYEIRAPL